MELYNSIVYLEEEFRTGVNPCAGYFRRSIQGFVWKHVYHESVRKFYRRVADLVFTVRDQAFGYIRENDTSPISFTRTQLKEIADEIYHMMEYFHALGVKQAHPVKANMAFGIVHKLSRIYKRVCNAMHKATDPVPVPVAEIIEDAIVDGIEIVPC